VGKAEVLARGIGDKGKKTGTGGGIVGNRKMHHVT